jgi:GNAT superfamily N-acetyltransferase
MMSSRPIIRSAEAKDMLACAAILNAWIDATEWMPRVHDHGDVERYYCQVVFKERRVSIAENDGQACAFMALSGDGYVTALYADPAHRNAGLGKHLIDSAKTVFPKKLQLWTFEANKAAQRFYRREMFSEVKRTAGDNEEGLPDILLQWTASGAHA